MRIQKKSLKTPTGAHIVDGYSTSTTDGYSCNHINNAIKEVYSTSEVKTNKVWIDGKPIYRKTIIYDSSTTLANGATNIAHNVNNMGTYRNIEDYGFFYQGALYKGYQDSTFSGEVNSINNTNIVININGWGNLFKQAYFTIEYTKTTD